MLKALMLRKKIQDKQATLESLRATAKELEKREKDLETDITEAKTEEEKQTVEAAVTQYEQDKAANDKEIGDLETEITGMEQELEEVEKKQDTPAADTTGEPDETGKEKKEMKTRKKFFGMTVRESDAFFADENVKSWLSRIREIGKSKRSITGAELLIPEVALDLVKEVTMKYSKLYKHVNVKPVPGKARQNVMGAIPEAFWTEMCGFLNELNINFNNVEVDGYKVGGYVAISNAVLEDSDIALATEVITAIGQSIGYALDKAILYGKGTKMPLGIVTRLVQATKPEGYSETARTWEDLSTSNVVAITGKTDAALFKELVLADRQCKGRLQPWRHVLGDERKDLYQAGSKCPDYQRQRCNRIRSGRHHAGNRRNSKSMPFIPDDVIIGGYGDLYLLAERAGTALAQSEHVRFIEDQTVFRGTARYDGLPVIPEGFVAIGIGGTKPTATMTFAEDTANKDKGGE